MTLKYVSLRTDIATGPTDFLFFTSEAPGMATTSMATGLRLVLPAGPAKHL